MIESAYDDNNVGIKKSFAKFAKSAGGYGKQWSKWKICPWSSPIRIYRVSPSAAPFPVSRIMLNNFTHCRE
jgi:hypothetical protein